MKSMHACAVTVLLLALPLIASADKTDVVRLVNGDAVTGEIKSLEFSSLSYSTDSMGTVAIDWDDVVGITSEQSLQVEIIDGTRYFGSLESAGRERLVLVKASGGPVTLTLDNVVRITPIETEESFWSRVDGSFSLGFTGEKSTEVVTFNMATDMQYRQRKYLVGLTANASLTSQPDVEDSQRSTIGVNYQRFRPNRWFTDWFVNWETNEQLGIANRYIIGGGLGRYLVQTNKTQFSVTAGVNGTREQYVGDEENSTEAEGRLQMRYLHRRLKPDARISLTTNVYPLLSDFSDFRSETDLSFRREFIEDLYLDITLYHSYASDPPADSDKEDYGVTTSLAYSW